MKSALLLTFVLLCCVQIQGGLFIAKTDPQVTSSHCFTDSFNVGAMDKNEIKQVKNECMKAQCQEDRSITFAGCGTVGTGPPCHVAKGDKSKPYPDCCPYIKCPK